MRSVVWLLVGSLGLSIALPGCATRRASTPAERSEELLSLRPAPPGRDCQIVPIPDTLPAANRLVDTAALNADLRDLASRDRDEPGYVLASLEFDRFGANIRRDIIEHNVRQEVADSLQRLIFQHRRVQEEAERGWGVRLRIELDDAPQYAVGRQEYCAPRPRDASLAMAMETTMGSGTRYRDGYRESTVWVRVVVNSQGNVTDARIERGIVAGTALEQRIFDYARTLFFDPAIMDGQPTVGTVSIPVFVRTR